MHKPMVLTLRRVDWVTDGDPWKRLDYRVSHGDIEVGRVHQTIVPGKTGWSWALNEHVNAGKVTVSGMAITLAEAVAALEAAYQL
jgi:hypothetical protein